MNSPYLTWTIIFLVAVSLIGATIFSGSCSGYLDIIFPGVRDRTGCEDIHTMGNAMAGEPIVVLMLLLFVIALIALIKLLATFKKDTDK